MDLRNRKKLPTQNDAETLTMGSTERILKKFAELYETGNPSGSSTQTSLREIADHPLLKIQIHKPRRRVTVMVVGNHSAGKSSFINWYVGESIQKTGVAIETKGFSFITSGRRRETLKGDATLMYYEHLEGFEKFAGILPNLFTEVSVSKERNFPCVDFVDTPGLVDGDIHYAYDVDGAIVWLADHVDLILVLFDPIGQALTSRTMDVIQRLSARHADRLLFYMSKADQVEREDDRQRVLIQITQNITARIQSTHAFKLPTFYLPSPSTLDGSGSSYGIPNAIDDVCEEIDKAIRLTVQKNLTDLKLDCNAILEKITKILEDDSNRRLRNYNRSRYGFSFLLAAWATLGAFVLVSLHLFLVSFPWASKYFTSMLDRVPELSVFQSHLGLSSRMLSDEEKGQYLYALGTLSVCYAVFTIASKIIWKAVPVLSKKDTAVLRSYRNFVEEVLKLREGLYKEYFKQLQNVD